MLTTDRGSNVLGRVAETRVGPQPQGRYPSTYGPSDTWELLWRYRRLSLMVLAIGVLASAVIAMSLTPIYTATSVIVFDRNDSRPYEAVVEAQRQERDRSTMETELDVIKSRVFIGLVVDALNLSEDPFYNTYLPPIRPVADDWFRARANWIVGKITRRDDLQQTLRARSVSKTAQRDRAISKLSESFTVDRKGESLALSIKVDQISPPRAAEIADALARHYVAWTSQLKEVATRNTVQYLNKQAENLASTITAKEREIAVFTSESGLTFDPKDDLLRARTEQLNEQLTLARVEEAGAQAQVRETKRRFEEGQEDVGRIFTSPLLTNLRTEEGTLQRLHGQLTAKFGAKHPLVADAEAELSSNRNMIADEAARIVKELENTAQIAELKVRTFENEVASLQERLKGRNLAEIKRRELERDLLSEQKRYDAIVLRLNLLNPEEEEAKPTATIASFAEVPVEPSFPKPVFIVLAGLVGSVLITVIVIIIADAIDDRLYKPSSVEELTERANIVQLPDFRRGGRTTHDFHRTILRNPVFAQAITSLCLAWRTIDRSSGGKVLMLASAQPGDGKTTLSLAMAATVKANGMRAIVVDLDPSPRGAGALSGFARTNDIEEIVSVDWEGITSLIKVSPSYPFLDVVVARLALQHYGRLFDMLRKSYDLVIVDTAATSISEDAVWISSYVDSVLLVVRAGKTKEKQLLEIIQRFNFDSALLIGSVMNFYGKPPLLKRNQRQGLWNRLWPRRNYA